MKTHKDLNVWKESMDLVEEVYRLTASYPAEERFSLISQMRRSAISVPANIAEGAARNTSADFCRFLYIGLGSLVELETQILLSERLGYLKVSQIIDKLNQIRAMLLGLIHSLRKKGIKPT